MSSLASRNKVVIPHNFRYVEFDRKKIRAGISLPCHREALRFTAKPVYNQLIIELYEDNCPITAKYFQIFAAKEKKLYEGAAIRDRVFNNPKLLMSLFDNCKMAEKAIALNSRNGDVICCHLMLQNALLCEKYGQNLTWLIYDVYETVTKICTKLMEKSQNSKEYLCKLYCRYALLLHKVGKRLIQYLLEINVIL